MKKRAQLPDSYTFTILFRGLSSYPHLSKTTSRALSIYQSMFAENSPVRPSIIHTNAVVNVCARAHDIDALLGIAADLPVHGSGAPNKLTYTIILNAIQSNAAGEYGPQIASSRRYDSERMERIILAVQQGRRLWLEIKQRWMSGDLALDEDLVCAMGRLLLLGRKTQDLDDVLSLLEQTMGIPRQIARPTNPAPQRAEKASGPEDDSELPPDSPANVELETLLSSPNPKGKLPRSPSDPFAPPSSGPRSFQSAVRPGRNTLSLVLEACIALRYVRGAQNYWGLLTSPDSHYSIVPDGENHHMYLRLLRVQRASKLAVEFVDEMRSGKLTGNARDVQAKTFRIALSCCVRDINNRDSLVHAGALVRMMTDTLPHPDAKALILYLKVALSQKPRDWRIIMGVIRGTELGVRNLRSLMAYDPAGRQKQNHKDVLDLVKGMIGAYDVVLDLGNEEIKKEEKKKCKEQRFQLAAYVTRINTKYDQIREWRKRKELEDKDTGREPTDFQRKKMLEKRLPLSGG